MSDKERELVEYFIKIVEETPSLHEKWINPPIKITTWKYLLELDKRLEDIKIINEEHRVLNGKLREELEFEKATNKELLSTGADLENKLYEEQDKNIRLNNIINEALGIANERVNYYHHTNKKEILEDWENIFNVLLRRDNE